MRIFWVKSTSGTFCAVLHYITVLTVKDWTYLFVFVKDVITAVVFYFNLLKIVKHSINMYYKSF